MARTAFTSLLLVLTIGLVQSCTVLAPDDGALTIVTYNVENLFDAFLDGTEYEEFTPSAGWDTDDVTDRLERIANVLEHLPRSPDILGIAEIENRALLDTLFDRFYVESPYPYRVFCRNIGGATGVAIVSRYPISEVRTLQARAGEMPPLRPVVEAHIDLPKTTLVVFMNHWKSKRGGAAATEALRIAGSRLVVGRIEELVGENPLLPIAVCGDLNEEPCEGAALGFSYETALLPADRVLQWREGTDTPSWFDPNDSAPRRILFAADARDARSLADALNETVFVNSWAEEPSDGSYWFYGRWEQIDHILVNPAAADGPVLSNPSLLVARDPAWCDADGRPISWFDDTTGASDHLPILLELDMEID